LALGGNEMAVVKIIIQIIFILLCIALTVLVLMQEGKSAGLGAISGMAETYWGKNKGRSMEGKLVTITKVLAVLFVVIAIILNINF
jgi:preprotein translocase subunit SecG